MRQTNQAKHRKSSLQKTTVKNSTKKENDESNKSWAASFIMDARSILPSSWHSAKSRANKQIPRKKRCNESINSWTTWPATPTQKFDTTHQTWSSTCTATLPTSLHQKPVAAPRATSSSAPSQKTDAPSASTAPFSPTAPSSNVSPRPRQKQNLEPSSSMR